jgi:histidinol dehydrogenase
MKIMDYSSMLSYKRSVAQIDRKYLETVSEILENVRKEGDKAVLDYTKKFDRVESADFKLTLSEEEKQEAREVVNRDYQQILVYFLSAAENIRQYHSRQKQESWFYQKDGCFTGQLTVPIQKAGVYIPGGMAFYPSTLLMNVIPAKIAGVPEIYVITPPRENGKINPLLIVLCEKLGVTQVFKAGGAQAIAAFTFGTETIPKVNKITGPGNTYVATAKRLIMGQVGIDAIAGSSEVVLFADDSANPEWAAVDLCAQSEHTSDNTSILISTSRKFIDDTLKEVEKLLPALPRKDIIQKSLEENAFAVCVDNFEQGFELINRIAPEHVEVILDLDTQEILANIHNAGAVFIGNWTPVAVSDYYAGPNHVIPTNGTAAFSSPLGVYDFVKHTSFLSVSENYIRGNGNEIAAMAEFEGLSAHALSVKKRMKGAKQ